MAALTAWRTEVNMTPKNVFSVYDVADILNISDYHAYNLFKESSFQMIFRISLSIILKRINSGIASYPLTAKSSNAASTISSRVLLFSMLFALSSKQ